jgi:adenylate cyclase
MATNRLLAAILFTDIEGYTALMQQDERMAISMKDRHREVFQKMHQQFNGRIIRYYGDGTLSIFQSAVDAVKCTVAMQQHFVQWPKIPVRIGLHTGDITIDEEDIFGDGVNLASRIESLGMAGSVLISDKVNDEIHNHPELKTISAGTYRLKNIERPVEVFAIIADGLVVPKTGSLKGKTEEKTYIQSPRETKRISKRLIAISTLVLLALATGSYFLLNGRIKKQNKPTDKWLAVLPFRLISNDSSILWLSNGFTEELTGSIAGISNLKVKSPVTMLQYRNSPKTTRQIAEELNVNHLIDGSLQKEGSDIIINARLINPLTDEILKNFKFRKDASEIKFIYSEVAQQIADVLNVTLTSEEIKRLQQTTRVDPEVYNLYLQGLFYAQRLSYEDALKSIGFFDKALEKDPGYAPALAGKAWGLLNLGWSGAISPEKTLQDISPILKKAIALDSGLSLSYSVSGWSKLTLEWDLDEGGKQFIKAYQNNPGDDQAISGLMFRYLYDGLPKEAQKWWETGKATSPKSWWIDAGYGMTLYFLGKIPEAIKHLQECIRKYGHFLFYDKLGWIYSLTGQNKEAIDILEKELKEFNFRFPSSLAWLAVSYYNSGNSSKAQEILNEMEKMVSEKKQNAAVHLAAAYSFIGQKEKALNMLDKAYELRDMDIIWLKGYPHFQPIHNVPRYNEMLKKVGLK